MRLLASCFCIFLSQAAFANPFANFVGNYVASGKTQTSSEGMKYCNFYGMQDLIGINISMQNGNYVADVTSTLDNSVVHEYVTFQEYSYAENGITDTAELRGDASQAIYLITDKTQYLMQTEQWILTKSGDGIQLHFDYRRSDQTASTSSCSHTATLKKR